MSERDVLHDIRLALGRERDLVLWRNNAGVTLQPDGSWVRYGVGTGGSDLLGILGPNGRFFALEAKTPTGRVEKHQAMWQQIVRHHGGFAAVVHSVDEARAALERARRGERQ